MDGLVLVVLGLVLGPMIEHALRRSLIMSKGSYAIFFHSPISAVFIALALVMLVSPFFTRKGLAEDIMKQAEED